MIDNYADLPLGTYLEIDRIISSDREEVDKQVDIIALLSGMDRERILALPLTDYSELSGKASFLKEPCNPVTAPSRLIRDTFVLLPTVDYTKLTTAQYIDFQTYAKGGASTLAELLAVLLIPEGKTYNEGYEFRDVVDAVKELPLPVALGLVGFFFDSLLASTQAFLTSLTPTARRMSKDKREALRKEVERVKALLTPGAGLPT